MSRAEDLPFCCDCQSWWPYHLITSFGTCRCLDSVAYDKVQFADKRACERFARRSTSLEEVSGDGYEFLWCMTCRETFHALQLPLHEDHKVYLGASTNDVEENAEVTSAGD